MKNYIATIWPNNINAFPLKSKRGLKESKIRVTWTFSQNTASIRGLIPVKSCVSMSAPYDNKTEKLWTPVQKIKKIKINGTF